MLVELGVVEQRYRAVVEVLEGASVTEVARRYGVARQTLHSWLRRYAADGGIANLADRSSRPDWCPHQMPAVVEARVLAIRAEHPGWGPARIGHQLLREGVDPVPGRSSIYRCLVRHRVIDPSKRRRRRADYRRWERGRSMELWQMDVMGRVLLVDGSEVKVVTGSPPPGRVALRSYGSSRQSGSPRESPHFAPSPHTSPHLRTLRPISAHPGIHGYGPPAAVSEFSAGRSRCDACSIPA